MDHWLMVGSVPRAGGYRSFDSMDEALDASCGSRIFLIPNEGVDISAVGQVEDPVFVFGNTRQNLKDHVQEQDDVVHIKTPLAADMFAAACLPLVLHEFRQ